MHDGRGTLPEKEESPRSSLLTVRAPIKLGIIKPYWIEVVI